MRLWSLHPKYLDSQGLVALWRETLLAKAVLHGETKGYRHHPQLHRFIAHAAPRCAVNAYLDAVSTEAESRGFRFNRTKIGPVRKVESINVSSGQIRHEWQHLLQKLRLRSPADYERWRSVRAPEAHPLFAICSGPVEAWERGTRPPG